uniref:Uncharacterized protein AlNc14C52G4053 n=1 Tax=Albugo laibachii Nc14 TaxID=890382 RepID=F0WBK8_9STRA|nr:conserved hypothetical protein [Albugo laibachii Nc14]|eukprot:CCA18535.1 conserved hypothetical protein [Albugo laibachii Nc14]
MLQIPSDSQITTNSNQNILVSHSSNTNSASDTNLDHKRSDAESFMMEGGTLSTTQIDLKNNESHKHNSSKQSSPRSGSGTQCITSSSIDSVSELNGDSDSQSAIRTLRTSNSESTLSKNSSPAQGKHDGNHRPLSFNRSEEPTERNTTTSPVVIPNSCALNYNHTDTYNPQTLFDTNQPGRVLRTNDTHLQSKSTLGPTTTVHVAPSSSVLLDPSIPKYHPTHSPYVSSALTPQSIRLNQFSSMRKYPPSDNIEETPARFLHSNSPLLSSAPITSRSLSTHSVCDPMAVEKRGQKRRLPYLAKEVLSTNHAVSTPQNTTTSIASAPRVPSSTVGSVPSYNNGVFRQNAAFEDSYSLESRASHTQRDEHRYETWTSKQLRKKCSHLKLRGLKNVKKHVMVDALYRYYRNLRHQEATVDTRTELNGRNETTKGTTSPHLRQSQLLDSEARARESLRYYYRALEELRAAGSIRSGRDENTTPFKSIAQPVRGTHPSNHMLEDSHSKTAKKESLVVTSEDVILLVDVVLSIEFVDRLATELSRWKFWVDVRERYVARYQSLLDRNFDSRGQNRPNSNKTGDRSEALSNYQSSFSHTSPQNWSSMQLWAMWKELTQVYSKACFAFTAAGAEERDYIQFCQGRPDVFYFHQCLHTRPEVLHLIRSSECAEDQAHNDTTESGMEQDKGAGSKQLGQSTRTSSCPANGNSHRNARPSNYDQKSRNAGNFGNCRSPRESWQAAPIQTGGRVEENTESSETTGEDSNGRHSRSTDSRRYRKNDVIDQKYFGMLLQNFEATFESLHNKKILLAALRRDPHAPDHLIADLQDDIHVLSALKRELKNKLRCTME